MVEVVIGAVAVAVLAVAFGLLARRSDRPTPTCASCALASACATRNRLTGERGSKEAPCESAPADQALAAPMNVDIL